MIQVTLEVDTVKAVVRIEGEVDIGSVLRAFTQVARGAGFADYGELEFIEAKKK